MSKELTIRGLSSSKIWDYENGFYWFSSNDRLAKLLAHYELYKKIVDLPGDIAEFGVLKGNSLIQLALFRECLENAMSRKIYAFDAFGRFPSEDVAGDDDKIFIEKFSESSGDGNSVEEIEEILRLKGIKGVTCVKGDVRDTFPDFLRQRPAVRFSLVHLDMDVYEPTAAVLPDISKMMVRGGVIMLDDYGTVEGETRAVDEFLSDRPDLKIKKLPFRDIPSYIQF